MMSTIAKACALYIFASLYTRDADFNVAGVYVYVCVCACVCTRETNTFSAKGETAKIHGRINRVTAPRSFPLKGDSSMPDSQFQIRVHIESDSADNAFRNARSNKCRRGRNRVSVLHT